MEILKKVLIDRIEDEIIEESVCQFEGRSEDNHQYKEKREK